MKRWLETRAVMDQLAAWHAAGNVNDVVAAVRARFGSRPGALLIKGSRGMRLERVVEGLLEEG